MTTLQQTFILIFGLLNFGVLLKGYFECRKNRSFGLINRLSWLGIFVWGDAVVIGFFWVVVALIALLANSWWLFLFIVSLFWVVRSLGEVIYWLNQQFSTVDRNPIEDSLFYPIFKNQSVWFVHQVMWQCVMVLALVASAYTGWQWLQVSH